MISVWATALILRDINGINVAVCGINCQGCQWCVKIRSADMDEGSLVGLVADNSTTLRFQPSSNIHVCLLNSRAVWGKRDS
jgi:hypothetical protein